MSCVLYEYNIKHSVNNEKIFVMTLEFYRLVTASSTAVRSSAH